MWPFVLSYKVEKNLRKGVVFRTMVISGIFVKNTITHKIVYSGVSKTTRN